MTWDPNSYPHTERSKNTHLSGFFDEYKAAFFLVSGGLALCSIVLCSIAIAVDAPKWRLVMGLMLSITYLCLSGILVIDHFVDVGPNISSAFILFVGCIGFFSSIIEFFDNFNAVQCCADLQLIAWKPSSCSLTTKYVLIILTCIVSPLARLAAYCINPLFQNSSIAMSIILWIHDLAYITFHFWVVSFLSIRYYSSGDTSSEPKRKETFILEIHNACFHFLASIACFILWRLWPVNGSIFSSLILTFSNILIYTINPGSILISRKKKRRIANSVILLREQLSDKSNKSDPRRIQPALDEVRRNSIALDDEDTQTTTSTSTIVTDSATITTTIITKVVPHSRVSKTVQNLSSSPVANQGLTTTTQMLESRIASLSETNSQSISTGGFLSQLLGFSTVKPNVITSADRSSGNNDKLVDYSNFQC